MIVLFSDFGLHGPYLGQVRAVLYQANPKIPVIDLISDAPVFNPKASAYLLAAYSRGFPPGTVFLAVVDPGVGSEQRQAAIVQADGRWYVGPDNGLFNVIAAHATEVEAWYVKWRPRKLSASFHGRDLFAPIAADLANGKMPDEALLVRTTLRSWGESLLEVIYVDHFGNLITGIYAERLKPENTICIGSVCLKRARTFSDVPQGTPMFYENANGLIEIAVNQGRADDYFSAGVGHSVSIQSIPNA